MQSSSQRSEGQHDETSRLLDEYIAANAIVPDDTNTKDLTMSVDEIVLYQSNRDGGDISDEGMRNHCNVLAYVQNHFGGAFVLNVDNDRSRNQRRYLYDVYAFLFLVMLVR